MSYIKSEQIKNPNGIEDEAAHIILEGTYKYFVLAPLEELGKHVLSFWVKGKDSGNMTVNYLNEHKEISVTTEWKKVVFKFNAEAIANIWIYFSGTEYWMYNTQLELGDFATDYSRNPKDIEQDIDDTKEQVEQYRKETAAEILITQEKITQSVTSLEERISKDYYTKTETNSLVSITQSGILQTVSANITETRTYADTVATNAKNAAITDTTNRLKSYSTTTQMYSAIEQKADAITTTVSATYTTKTETTNAINNINVGNRNILLKTNHGDSNWSFTFQNGTFSKTSTTVLGVNACKFTITTASTGYAVVCYNNINRSIISSGKKYTLEFDILPNKAVNVNVRFMQSNGINSTGDFGTKSFSANTWGHYSGTVTFNNVAIGSQVIYITGLNQTGLQFTIANLIMVEGNKCSNWNPAPEDVETTITETTVQLQSQITQTQANILQTVSATYATNGTVDQVKSSVASVEITANKINWLVKSGTSAANFELTDRTASLVASYININGLVEFSGLNKSTQTVINNATTNAQTAKDRVAAWSAAKDTTMIDGGKIYTGSITAEKISVSDLNALNATIAGWHIGTSAIYRGSDRENFYTQGSMYFGYQGISISNNFKVDSAGSLYSGSSSTYTLLNSGNIHFYESSSERMMLGSGEFNGSFSGSNKKVALLNAGYSAKALLIGRKTSSNDSIYTNSIIINNGLNPYGNTEGVIIDGTTRFRNSVTFASSVIFSNSVNFSSSVTFSAYTNFAADVYVSGTSFTANKIGAGGNTYGINHALYVTGDSYMTGTLHVNGTYLLASKIGVGKNASGNITYGNDDALWVTGSAFMGGNVKIGHDSTYYTTLYSDGSVSIGGTLYVGGTASFESVINAWGGVVDLSDKKLKENIKELDLEKTLDFIKKLIPSSYTYKKGNSGRTHHGFIAQEVKEAMGKDDWGLYVDSSYSADETGEKKETYKALRYNEIIADAVLAIQYCLKEIEELKKINHN